MKMFNLDHPDKVDALPAEFVGWAFEFERVETEAREELQKRAQQRR